ncbi:MAG TPA: hypothetical protein VIQ99_06895 [Gammaproteobacteria bacterium]
MIDLVLIATLVIAVLATAMRRPRAYRSLRWLTLGVCGAQLAIEGPRIELVPAYFVAVVIAVLALIDTLKNGLGFPEASSTRPARSRVVTFLRWITAGAATVLLSSSLVLCVALDSLDYPTPSGPYAVGTTELHLIDVSRAESFTESDHDHREISVRVSYPATNDAAFAALSPDTVPSIAALVVGGFWPNPVTTSWGAIPTHARRGPSLAAAQRRYPVLIFSHAMGGYPEQNTALVEHLVSHGYVVMAVNHPYLSARFRFADGSMIGLEFLLRPNPFPDDAQRSLKEDALGAKLADPGISTAERVALVRQRAAINLRSTDRWAGIHQVMSDDQRFVLDSLAVWPADSLLAGRLDLDRVGVFGMSSGGTATHMTCAADSRCRAGLNLDGFQPLLIDLPPLRAPFMHMSRATVFTNAIAQEQSLALSYIVRVEGAEHLSFTDNVLTLHRFKYLGELGNALGTIDPERMVQLVNDYALAFFDESLLGRRDSMLEGSAQRYPEASIESKHGVD